MIVSVTVELSNKVPTISIPVDRPKELETDEVLKSAVLLPAKKDCKENKEESDAVIVIMDVEFASINDALVLF